MAACAKHPFDDAVDLCRSCARAFCAECLVYVYGHDRPPLCVPCALVAAGVRRRSRAERRARPRQQAANAFAAHGPPTEHFGPMSARGRALLAARNGHSAKVPGGSPGNGTAHEDAPVHEAPVHDGRRRRFLGLF